MKLKAGDLFWAGSDFFRLWFPSRSGRKWWVVYWKKGGPDLSDPEARLLPLPSILAAIPMPDVMTGFPGMPFWAR